MSKLWLSFLEQIRILGNNSGCHQLPERSFFINGKQLPICARCTGVTLGEAAAVIFRIVKIRIKNNISIICILIMGFDWFIQEINVVESTNIRRLITGFIGGLGVFSLYINFFECTLKFINK